MRPYSLTDKYGGFIPPPETLIKENIVGATWMTTLPGPKNTLHDSVHG